MKVYSHHILKLRAVALMAVVAGLFLSFKAQAALNAYLILTMNGVPIHGDVTQAGRSNMIQVISWESEIYRSGISGSPVVHRPIKFLKEVDKATPKIADVLYRNQTGTAIFRFWRPNSGGGGGGVEFQFMTVTLDGVRITSQRILMPNNKNPELQHYFESEELTFSYTSITIHHTATDSSAVLEVETP